MVYFTGIIHKKDNIGNKIQKCYENVTDRLTDESDIFIIGHMNRLRDGAIVLGLAGVLLMASADTKDVEAKISYESESIDRATEDGTAGAIRGIGNETLCALAENSMNSGRMRQAYTEAQADWSGEEATETEPVAEAATVQPELAALQNSTYQLTAEDYDALLRIVEAEASGEDETGRLLVANVVLNRVRSAAFPDTVYEVVYQQQDGKAQFSPVGSGKIDRVTVSDETRAAVERALAGEDASGGALYFVNPSLADAGNLRWFRSHLTLVQAYHGHEFYL